MFRRKWQLSLTIFALSLVCTSTLKGQVQKPFCPFIRPENLLPHIRLQNSVSIPKDVRWATILIPRREIKIEIETNKEGKISCATPLRFASDLLLPYVTSAIENAITDKTIPLADTPRLIILPDPRPLPPRGHPRIIVVPDLYHPPPDALKDPELAKLTCDSKVVDELLDVVRQLNREHSRENIHKQLQCMNAAMAFEPNSFALQILGSRVYAAALISRDIVGIERQEFLENSFALARSALALEPQSINAQNQLSVALYDLGKADEEEKVTLNLTSENNPPGVRESAYTRLIGIYDAKDNRHKALLAARKAEQIAETIDAIEAGNKDELTYNDLAMTQREDLAIREEEAGEYVLAASDYEAARGFAKPGLYYDGVFFKIDMGLSRSLRRIGQSKDADALCKRWRHRATSKFQIYNSLNHGGAVFDSGGSDIVNATWEFSCGNFDVGVQDLLRISKSRLQNPSYKWGEGTVGYYLRAPLKNIESAFMSRGRVQIARQTREILSLDLDSASRDQLDEALKRLETLKESVNTYSVRD